MTAAVPLRRRLIPLLLGPLAARPYARVEGAEVEGQESAPVLRVDAWIEAPPHAPVIERLRLQVTHPFKAELAFELRDRRHGAPLTLPLDTEGISPRLTLIAPLGGRLPAVRGLVLGRIAPVAVGRPAWSPVRALYRWDLAPPAAEGG